MGKVIDRNGFAGELPRTAKRRWRDMRAKPDLIALPNHIVFQKNSVLPGILGKLRHLRESARISPGTIVGKPKPVLHIQLAIYLPARLSKRSM